MCLHVTRGSFYITICRVEVFEHRSYLHHIHRFVVFRLLFPSRSLSSLFRTDKNCLFPQNMHCAGELCAVKIETRPSSFITFEDFYRISVPIGPQPTSHHIQMEQQNIPYKRCLSTVWDKMHVVSNRVTICHTNHSTGNLHASFFPENLFIFVIVWFDSVDFCYFWCCRFDSVVMQSIWNLKEQGNWPRNMESPCVFISYPSAPSKTIKIQKFFLIKRFDLEHKVFLYQLPA